MDERLDESDAGRSTTTTGGTAAGGASSAPSSIGCRCRRTRSVLDAGCGSGRTLEELADYGEVHGIELDPGAAELARGRGVRRGPRSAGSRSCPGRTDTFDLITCLDVIEHTPDDRATLRELRRVCQPGRVAAGHGARLPGAVVTARRGQPPLPPLLAAHAARRGAAAGWTRAADDLVQQPAAGAGGRGAAGRSGGGTQPTATTSPT